MSLLVLLRNLKTRYNQYYLSEFIMKKMLIIAVVLIAACATKPMQPQNTAPQYYTHTVSGSGETLASIAKWYTGSTTNWQAIQAANPGLDPKRMRIGTQVQIPNNMLIKTAAMPRTKTTQTAKSQDVEILQPAQDSLANSQTNNEVSADGSVAPSNNNPADNNPAAGVTDEFPASGNAESPANNGEEVVVKELSPEEIAALKAETPDNSNPEQKKSILSKFQEAALKAQEKSLNGEAKTANTQANTQAQVDGAQAQAKAAVDAGNAQVKAAQDQAAKTTGDAQKLNADAQTNSAKTRDDLIKELTQDY
jgi:hypothetical protein